MRVLVVGGAGYVGGYLVDLLLANQNKYQTRVVDNLLYEDYYFKDVDFFNIDILDFEKMTRHLQWADCVIWLAALVGDPACALNPKLTFDINVNSIKFLTHEFKGRIIFPSTCSVYGAQSGLLDEQSTLNPLSLYAETKLLAENIIKQSSSNYLIFRLGTLFGISDSFARLRLDLVLNTLSVRATLNKKMSVFGGAQFRPLLHVRDVGLTMVDNINSGKIGVYNLHSENLTILELANRIKSKVPESEIETTEISFQDARNYRVVSDLAMQELNFNPKYSIEFGIEQLIDVTTRGRIKNFSNPRFINSEALRDLG